MGLELNWFAWYVIYMILLLILVAFDPSNWTTPQGFPHLMLPGYVSQRYRWPLVVCTDCTDCLFWMISFICLD